MKNANVRILIASFVLSYGCVADAASPIPLAVRGQSQHGVIALLSPEEPSAVYAAEELRDYVEKLTGVRMEISRGSSSDAVAVLRCDVKDGDCFHLKAEEGKLLVTGGRTGVLYGVYEILETYGGVGWFSSWCETVPRIDRLEIPGELNRMESPAFDMRELYWKDAFEGDFAARLRVVDTHNAKTTAKHGRGQRFDAELWLCHTFEKLMPPVDKYFETHPEYYAESSGVRSRADPGMMQPCLTNPDVQRIIKENFLACIARAPATTKYFGLSQNDTGSGCQCAKCSAVDQEEGSHAGTVIRFVNQVADEVAKAHPDKIVETLAYRFSRNPPKTPCKPNVMPCVCTVECDCSRPLTQSRYAQNIAFVKDLKGWAGISRQLYVWDYAADFCHYLKPFENLKCFQPNIRLFREVGAKGLLMQGAWQGWHGDMAELKAWVVAKLMWNPDYNVKALVRRFTDGYYGAAAPYVRKYLALLYSAPRDETVNPVTITDPVGADPVLTDEFLQESGKLWEQALEAMKDDPIRSYNVRMSSLPIDYVRFYKDGSRLYNVSLRPVRDVTALAKRILSALNEADAANHPICICEANAKVNDMRQKIEDLAFGRAKIVGSNGSAVIEESAIPIVYGHDKTDHRDDPSALDGRALWVRTDNCEWYTQYRFDNLRYDADSLYRVRVRVRAELSGVEGEAFAFGVYSDGARQNVSERRVQSDEVGSEYTWYELPPKGLDDSQHFWFAPGRIDPSKGPVCRNLWIDRLEIVRQTP